MTIGDLKEIIRKHEEAGHITDDTIVEINVSDNYSKYGNMAKTHEYDRKSSMNNTHFIRPDLNVMRIHCSLNQEYDSYENVVRYPKITFRKGK